MKNIFISVLAFFAVTFATVPAGAAIRPFYQDIKVPTQAMLEHQVIPAPVLASANYVLTTNAGATSAAAVTISSFTAQPDVPRNITITPTGTTSEVGTCAIVVNGTNILGKSISETFNFAATASTATVGNKAFKTVSSVVFPANCETGSFGATWTIGVGSKLGMKRCMAQAGDLAWSVFNGAFESTRGTPAASASDVSANTFIPNGTMDGTKDVALYFVQNFASSCQP